MMCSVMSSLPRYTLHLGDETCTVRAASPEAAKRKAAAIFADRRAGIVARRRNRETGTTILLIDSQLTDEFDSFAGRWQTICDEHGTICSHETRAVAESFMAVPSEWCHVCGEHERGAA